MSFSNLDPASRQQVIRALSRVDPATAVRLATVSRAMQNNSSQVQSQLDALKRVVRRKVARMRHFTPTGRLNENLWENRITAIRRGQMSPARRRAAIKRHLVMVSVPRAYTDYLTASRGNKNAAWNRFVRIYVKSGGRANITREQARNRYL